MGLMDKAKGLYEDHKDQIQQGLDKAKQTVNKATDSLNRAATQRLPNTGTATPVGRPGDSGKPPVQGESADDAALDDEDHPPGTV